MRHHQKTDETKNDGGEKSEKDTWQRQCHSVGMNGCQGNRLTGVY